MADSEELRSLHRELAKEAWKRSDDSIASSDAHTIQFGLMALRSPLIVLSASIVALLSFVSANSERLSGTAAEVGSIFTWLVIGLLFGGAGPAAAYFTQYLYTIDLCDHKRTFDHPYLNYPAKRIVRRWGICMHVATVIATIASYGCFLYSSRLFYQLLASLL